MKPREVYCRRCGAVFYSEQADITGTGCLNCGNIGMREQRLEDETSKGAGLADAHWRYIESVLRQHGEDEDVINKCGHHYKAAFEHGWKHAKEQK